MRWRGIRRPLVIEVSHTLAKLAECNVVGDHDGPDDHDDDELDVVSIEISRGGRARSRDSRWISKRASS